MSENKEKNGYEKLTPQRRRLFDRVMYNLQNNASVWQQGWKSTGVPVSGISKKRYNGVNRMFLSAAMMERGYTDNRWVTFRQMKERGWTFKRDAEGNSLGKNAGESVEYFELRDRTTKQPFDEHTLDGMTAAEKDDYKDENVYAIRKYYCVFNAEVIDGIPALERSELQPGERNERAEHILSLWNDTEAKITYGGNSAYYNKERDEIRLPRREDFLTLQEFYSTALHEVGHSTGHETRLNRSFGKPGTPEYAVEELRAEIASMFIEQDLGIEAEEKHVENNSAYIKHWYEKLKSDPNILFKAIADADRICGFVMAKENAAKKEVVHYSIREDELEQGVFSYMLLTQGDGKLNLGLGRPFPSREALLNKFHEMQALPENAGKEYREVDLDELKAMSGIEEKPKNGNDEEAEEVQPSETFLPPSAVAAISAEAPAPVKIEEEKVAAHGIDALTRMDDREIVDRAARMKHGEKFLALFNGETKEGGEEKDERSLMARLAMMTGDNERQLMRILRVSGQFREDKPISYYEKMAKEEMKFVAGLRASTPRAATNGKQGGRFANAK